MRNECFSLGSRTTPVRGGKDLSKSLSANRDGNRETYYSPVGYQRNKLSIVSSVCSSRTSTAGSHCGGVSSGDDDDDESEDYCETFYSSLSHRRSAGFVSGVESDGDESAGENRQGNQSTATKQQSDTLKNGNLSNNSIMDNVKKFLSWWRFQPVVTFWPSYSACKISSKKLTTADKYVYRTNMGTLVHSAFHKPRTNCNTNDCSCTLPGDLTDNGLTFQNCSISISNLKDKQEMCEDTTVGASPSCYDRISIDDQAKFLLHQNCLTEKTENHEELMQAAEKRFTPNPTHLHPYTNYCLNCNNLKSFGAMLSGSDVTSCQYRENTTSRLPSSQYREKTTSRFPSSPADRIVGLTIHCMILSIAVLAVVLAKWVTEVLKFFLYLALHTAVYRGRFLPLREDTEEAVTQQQLRDATLFDSTGLKIILLQYWPPRQSIGHSEHSAGLELDELSTETIRSATYTKKFTTNGNSGSSSFRTDNNSRKSPTPKKSISTNSDSSQELSHMFSNGFTS